VVLLILTEMQSVLILPMLQQILDIMVLDRLINIMVKEEICMMQDALNLQWEEEGMPNVIDTNVWQQVPLEFTLEKIMIHIILILQNVSTKVKKYLMLQGIKEF
jgi:hypothetical protein